MLKQQHQLFVLLLCLIDGLVVTLACALAWAVRRAAIEGYWPRGSWESWVKGPLFLFVVPIVLYMMWVFGLYRPRRDRALWTEQVQIAKVAVASMAAIVVALWAVGNVAVTGAPARPAGGPPVPVIRVSVAGWPVLLDAGRLQLGVMAVLLPVLLGLHRASFRAALRSLRRRGRNLRHVAIIGAGRLGQIACQTLRRNSWTGLNVAYFISHHPRTTTGAERLGLPVRGGLDDLETTIENHPVDAVYLCVPNVAAACVPRILQRLERFAVDVRIIPDVHPRFAPQSMALGELDGMPVLSYRESPLAGLGGLSKRVIDVAGALVGLVIFSPIMLGAALAVRLSSPGPVLFRQRRVSLGGKVFSIYKFRTMYHVEDELGDAPSLPPAAWTTRDDPRITPIGRVLRSTSLDELPQLLNVLRGEMSLVGPRPERPELIERFREDWRGYMLRQHVKAGMTGWAQVNGHRGDTSLRKRLQYDLFYIKHWSLWFDLRILWLTLVRGFLHRNAH